MLRRSLQFGAGVLLILASLVMALAGLADLPHAFYHFSRGQTGLLLEDLVFVVVAILCFIGGYQVTKKAVKSKQAAQCDLRSPE